MRARIIRQDGTTEPVELPDNGPGLSAMYAAIGCSLVDVVRVLEAKPGRPGIDMWIADDESVSQAEPNKVASLLCGDIAEREMATWLLGHVLVTGGADSEGDTLPLTTLQDQVIESMAAHYKRLCDVVDAAVEASGEGIEVIFV